MQRNYKTICEQCGADNALRVHREFTEFYLAGWLHREGIAPETMIRRGLDLECERCGSRYTTYDIFAEE